MREEATTLAARVALDGGEPSISTGLPVLDHLLGLLARHAGYELRVEVAPGAPDAVAAAAGRALGEAVRPLLADAAAGYGSAMIPADEALANVVLEASGRPLVVTNVDLTAAHVAGLDRDLVSGFLHDFAEGAGLTLHVRLLHGEDPQHVLESIFKALGGALARAGAGKE